MMAIKDLQLLFNLQRALLRTKGMYMPITSSSTGRVLAQPLLKTGSFSAVSACDGLKQSGMSQILFPWQ